MQSARDAMEKTIPAGQAEWDAWVDGGNFWFKYKLARGRIALGGSGSTITYGTRIAYSFIGAAHNGVRQPRVSCDAALNVAFASEVSWSADWTLGSKTNGGVSPDGSCHLGFINYDATGKVVDKARQLTDKFAGRIDDAIKAQTSFRPKAMEFWGRAQQPIRVADQMWLLLNPSEFGAMPINVAGDFLSSGARLVAKPAFYLSANAPAPATAPLPPLTTVKAGSGFHVALDGFFAFEQASKILAQQVKGRLYPFPGGRSITIRDASIYGNGDVAIVKIDFDGSAKGWLYLHGRPVYDVATETLSIQDLDYTVETRNIILKVADWLNHSGFVNSLQQSAHWGVGENIARAREHLQKAINQRVGDIELTGKVDSLRPLGVGADPKQFVVRVVADGSLSARYAK